jgi:uncharacterized protein YjbI with pentapeptide repeats
MDLLDHAVDDDVPSVPEASIAARISRTVSTIRSSTSVVDWSIDRRPRANADGQMGTGRLGTPTGDPGMCVVASEPLQDLELYEASLRELPELRERLEVGADPSTLVRCDLSGADLRGLDLPGWQFHECNLDRARLNGARLDSALLKGGSARSATFIDCDLAGARFEAVDACDARFGGALMTEAEFHGCRLMGTSFEGTRGLGMLLQNCNLYAANLNGCVLTNVALTGLRLTEASLRGADLRGSDLAGSVLLHADLYAEVTGGLRADCRVDLRFCLVGA